MARMRKKILETAELGICVKCKNKYPRNEEYFYKAYGTVDGLNRQCIVCVKNNYNIWASKNKQRCKELGKRWRLANKDKIKAYPKRKYKLSKKAQLRKSIYDRKRRIENPELYRLYTANRNAAKLHATPSWANEELMELVYVEANYRGLQVDHIIPLQGKNVCGLHVYNNTQLLTEEENALKHNRW